MRGVLVFALCKSLRTSQTGMSSTSSGGIYIHDRKFLKTYPGVNCTATTAFTCKWCYPATADTSQLTFLQCCKTYSLPWLISSRNAMVCCTMHVIGVHNVLVVSTNSWQGRGVYTSYGVSSGPPKSAPRTRWWIKPCWANIITDAEIHFLLNRSCPCVVLP